MSDNSKIEWLARPGTRPATWNPIRARHKKTGKVGWFCIHASIGCIGCYSEGMNLWVGNGVEFTAQMLDEVEIFLDEKILQQPLRWRDAHTVFPCSMTDLFGEWVTDEMIDRVFAVMALSPQHTYIVLTKRASRMRAYLTARNGMGNAALCKAINDIPARLGNRHGALEMPLPNVWLLVSVEDQPSADERIPELLLTPAALRGLSCEPLLAPILIWHEGISAATGILNSPSIDWVIIGGHSGRGAKVHLLSWSRALIDQCRMAGVPVFEKQLGSNAIEDRPGQNSRRLKTEHSKGGDPAEWPEDLRIRQFPEPRSST